MITKTIDGYDDAGGSGDACDVALATRTLWTGAGSESAGAIDADRHDDVL